jgi:four helix bundle protein
MTCAEKIQERLIRFAASIIILCDNLPLTTAGQHIAAQLLISGTLPALIRVEAHTAETGAEIRSKFENGVAALDESEFWLSIIIASNILPRDMLAPLIADCQQLQHALIASINHAAKPANRPPAAIDCQLKGIHQDRQPI